MLFSTANKSPNGKITMIVQVALCRVAQGLCFVAQFAVEIISANGCTYAFCIKQLHVFSIRN